MKNVFWGGLLLWALLPLSATASIKPVSARPTASNKRASLSIGVLPASATSYALSSQAISSLLHTLVATRASPPATCQFVPTSITVSGFNFTYAPYNNTTLTPSVTAYNNVTQWTSNNLVLRWSGSAWEMVDPNIFTVLATNTTGSITYLPATGWTVTGPSTNPTLSGGTGLLIGNLTTVSVSPSSPTIASGASVTLTASGATSYTWSNGSTVNPLVLTNVTSATAFSVTGVTGSCLGTASAAVSVTQPAVLTLATAATPNPICVGTLTSLSVTPSGGSAPYSYTWVAPEGTTLSATSTSAVSATATTSGVKTFTVTVSASGGSPTSTSTVTLTVNAPPTVSISPSSQTITQGQSATLTASGADSYVWSNGQSSAVVSTTTAGTYSVTGTATNGCSATASAAVSVTQAANPCVFVPQNITVSIAGTSPNVYTPNGTYNGAPTWIYSPYRILWFGSYWAINNGFGNIATNTTGSATYLPGTGWSSQQGTVTLSGGIGSLTAGLTVTIAPSSQTITSGGSVTLTASGATSYTWNTGSTANPLVLTNVTAAGTYSVTGTTGSCSNTATATVSVTAPSGPVLSVGPISTVTIGPGNCPGVMNFIGSGVSFTLTGPDYYSAYPVRGGAAVNRTIPFSGIKTTGQYTACAVGNAAQTPVCQTFTVTGQACP